MSENLLTALQVGQRLCWNEGIGYFLRGSVPGVNDGSLNPDVDCSYFVGYCLQQGGGDTFPRRQDPTQDHHGPLLGGDFCQQR